MTASAATPSVGVVICAYSSARWAELEEAVASVSRQSRPADEVVVVIDHNEDLLARSREAFPQARVVPSRGQAGLSGARNTGFDALHADIVAFLDDDARADPRWLETLAVAFDDPQVIGAGGWVVPRWQSEVCRWLAPEIYWIVGCSYRGLPPAVTEIRNPIGADMAFRREAMAALGGFREDVGRVREQPVGDEETDLAIRAHARWSGTRILHVPGARVYHDVPASRASWHYVVARSWAEGRSKAQLSAAVGSAHALSSERTYVTHVLPAGVLHGLRDALFRRDPSGLGRAASIVVSLAATVAGYAYGRIVSRTPGPSRRPSSPASGRRPAGCRPTRRR